MSENLQVFSPYDQTQIGELPLANDSEVENALATAYALYQNQKDWIPPYERVQILERLIPLMEKNKDHLIKTALSEGGKPYRDSVVEVNRAIEGVKLGVQAFHEVHGEVIPMNISAASAGRTAFTMREPIGVVASLSAFNHPLNLIIHQTVPAVVAGCPVIVKPATTTPLSCFEFVKLLHEAGLPKEWCQPINCSNELAEKIATDQRTSFLSFIGSAKVGWYLRSKLAPGAHCALEHGGAGPVVVDKDVDIDPILPALIRGAFYHAGQVCVSVQRIYVPNEMVEDFTAKLVKGVEALQVGDPALETTDVGPLILPREVTRVHEWVEEAVKEGATLATGGTIHSETCYTPTVLVNPADNSKVSKSEIFGPVVCVYGYSDREDAYKRANDVPFSFQAAVITESLEVAMEASERLNAAAVMINDHTAFRVDWMPFGGRKHSGMGVGGIAHSVRDMTEEKLVVYNRPKR